ncbi:hypothetical protein CCHR01_19537 [Colletotrichum chrysophilum]|uniref:Uncharacterized protein n=1 Tax=Colletotrichum chrysophilum TaxID=1836956 RepID=A0AAD9E7S4_9PEZI|nr:hypothetical protein CCHR01_19537 [Colletotrichum chrysophilum]
MRSLGGDSSQHGMGNTRLRFSCFQTSDCASLMPLGSQWPQLTSSVSRTSSLWPFGALEFENECALRCAASTKQSICSASLTAQHSTAQHSTAQHCGTISIEQVC